MEPGSPAAPVRAYFAALNSADLEGVLATFTPDAVVMVAGAETASGTEAIRALYERRFETYGYARELHVDEVMELAAAAVLRCHSAGSLLERATGRELPATAREIFVAARDEAGWRIRLYMNNLTSPL